MPELKHIQTPVIDCSDFDRFVEEVYGRKYSTVQGYSGSDSLGHYTYHNVDVKQWISDKEYETSEEREQWVKEMEEKYPAHNWRAEDDTNAVSFEEWEKKEGWDAHNDCPVIDEMVYHLRKDGYDVPEEFMVLVDW